MKLIELSKKGRKNKGKYFAQVDDEDYDWLNKWDWCVLRSDKHSLVYAMRRINKKDVILMHRQILGEENLPNLVDHEDHNGLNNQRHNLRPSTYTENNRNSTCRKNSASKYLGVCKEHYKKVYTNKNGVTKKLEYVYWLVLMKIGKKRVRLGSFKDEKLAALAYDKAAKEHYGEFANLNFK